MVKKRKAPGAKTNKRRSSLAEKTEQILLTMPRIIAAQIGKDLMVLKQQEAKLKPELKKLAPQKEKLIEKIAGLKQKNTAAAKKQAGTTQKALQKTQQQIKALVRDLDGVKKQIQMLSQKKAKYNALQAQLVTFQKEWTKKISAKTEERLEAKMKAGKKLVPQKSPGQQNLFIASEFLQEPRMIEVVKISQQEEVEVAEEPMERIS